MKAYKIIEKKYLWFGLSLAVIIIGIAFLIFQGFNWGIDFTGGNMLQFDIHQSFELADARSILEQLDIREFEVKKGGDTQQELIIKTTTISEDMQNKISESLKQKWPNTELIQAETIDAVIGKEMRQQAIIALILANIGMLIYITFRFEFKSAVAAVLALVHDVLIIISFYAIFHIPVDSTFIAVVLTIVGYSINDTIVVFDRIRENLKTMRKASFTDIANLSIMQTLARSINTSFTTLITITALFLLGGETIKDFSLALIVGIASGTYSSIFIATPLWEIFRDRTKTVKA
ncbi:protein translocase subunit SecF [Tepidanaerobacter syntrophicus]|uniref:Protein-export membrane protein SecF n=1 Tax=Tepidanaerobacter syntrophicus TaxID=224999 RepID=A0A0U9HQ65_9FIRM|nr:protein translocase subunit SecF [Tepidanaerobacter syntrophicus]GAQ26303.1 preprotein translocase subunit SecF [Tepidanaerobacter syntrophicus]GLI19291.1 protein-export membrane protein SecF [Tepidanaerobacter syntrophicus]